MHSRLRTLSDRWEISTLVAESTGRADRSDPRRPRTGGPAGNARLTAWTGVILLVLLAVEGITLIDVGALITWHIVVGALIAPLVLLKIGSTGWRMVRYYAGSRAYRQAGPPPLLLRVLAPLLVLSTLALIGSGVVVGITGPHARDSLWGTPVSLLFLHQASFAVWVTATTVHVLGRLLPAVRILGGRVTSAVDGGVLRVLTLVGVLGTAVYAASLVLGVSSGWVD